MPVKFDSETELAQSVVDYLDRNGWEQWFEVQRHASSPVADIVAQKDDVLLVVECKRSFGARLISDGMNWLGYADRIALAYPKRNFRDRRIHRAYMTLIGMYGLELWEVGKEYYYINEKRRTILENKKAVPKQPSPVMRDQLIEKLRDENKEWAEPGMKDGRRVTDFQLTCVNLREYVKMHPECTLKNAVLNIGHHYASDESAMGSLTGYIKKGIVDGIACQGSGRHMKLTSKEV